MMENSASVGKPRNKWVALIFSVLMPGLGHVYAGQPRRGLNFFVIILAFYSLQLGRSIFLNTKAFPVLMLVYLFAFVAFALFVHANAFKTAKATSQPYTLNKYNSGWVYLICIVVGYILISLVKPASRNYKVPSVSMLPTAHEGDVVDVNLKSACLKCAKPISRGEIWAFKHPTDDTTFLKRVIGLPGDTINYKDGELTVNGQKISSTRSPVAGEMADFEDHNLPGGKSEYEFVQETLDGKSYYTLLRKSSVHTDVSEIVVPEGQVFVLGDNRDNSNDSRFWGTAPLENFIGEVFYVPYSFGKDKINWARSGKTLY